MHHNPARPSLPIGWPLLPVPDKNGALQWPDLALSVRQTIRALLITEPGERLLHPKLGAAIQAFVHQPNALLTRRRLHDQIAKTLIKHEPRIALTQISVETSLEAPAVIDVRVEYQIRMTSVADAVSFSLGLEG